MKVQHFIVATAGHVDHGKSALVKALTGTDPDRLPEEKARGITIDLGFAFIELTAGGEAGAGMTYDVGIIDVPGHEDFVKNMVAGMGAIDAALLVVAADDGWMPQTQEHLEILNYLGVRHGVVAITKGDLGGGEALVEDVRQRLRGTGLAEAAIVLTSAKTGAGLADLKAALTKMLEATPLPRDCAKARLSVDRVFSLRGIGTVVTGTLAGGLLTRGQSLWVEPLGKVTRARTVQTHGRDVTHAFPGMRTAINMPDVTPGEEGVKRGDVIVGKKGKGVTTLATMLWRHREKGAEAVPLREGARVHLHIGSAERAATLQWAKGVDGKTSAIARLRLESAVYVRLGDRFVLRDWAARETVAGGIVVDLEPGRGWHHRVEELHRRASHVHDAAVWVETQVAWDLASPAGTLLEQSNFSSGDVEAAVDTLVKAERVKRAGDFVVDAAWWEQLQHEVATAVEQHHHERPQDPGMPLAMVQEAVRQQEGGRRVKGKLWEALLEALAKRELVTAGTSMKRSGYAPQLPPGLQKAGEAIRAALKARPFDPPSKKELMHAAGAGGWEAMTFLLNAGEALAVGEEGVMSSESVDEAARRIGKFLDVHGKGTVSELKAMLGTSRRIAVPLLEVMDARGVTVRRGDVRVTGIAPSTIAKRD